MIVYLSFFYFFFFFFKQKTAYEMRISDWSSDVCSSDLIICAHLLPPVKAVPHLVPVPPRRGLAVFRCAGFEEIGVLNTVQQRREPRQRVFVDHVDRLETE